MRHDAFRTRLQLHLRLLATRTHALAANRSAVALALLLSASTAHAADPAQGKAIYTAKCQACHGADGSGKGPAARALPKKPQDMTTAEFWDGMTDKKLEAVISTGKPGSAMRAFPMSDAQMADLIAYLRTFEPS